MGRKLIAQSPSRLDVFRQKVARKGQAKLCVKEVKDKVFAKDIGRAQTGAKKRGSAAGIRNDNADL